jgi:hypothetical protein
MKRVRKALRQDIDASLILADVMRELRDYPLEYVMFTFPWKDDPSIQQVPLHEDYQERFPGYENGPDKWACEFLDQLGDEIRKRAFDGKSAVDPIRS